MFKYTANLKKSFFGLLLLTLLCSSYGISAQGYFEGYSGYGGSNLSIIGGVGSTLLVGDIDDPSLAYATPGNAFQLNGGLSYRLTNYISIRAEATVFQLYSETKPNVWDHRPSVKTFGVDGYIALVHNILPQAKIDQGQGSINAYGLIGIGNTFFVPKNAETEANLRDENINQVGNEGYSKLALMVPVGFGVEYYFSSFFSIGGEVIYKITSTDFLDDIKPIYPAGAPQTDTNDSYYTFGLKLKYTLGKRGNGNLSGFNYKSYLKKSKRRAKYK